MSYQHRLIHLNLLPINYWLEYLDLLFFFKCKLGIVRCNIENYVNFCNSKSRRGASGIYLATPYCRTSLFRDSFFVRLSNIWNAVLDHIKAETSLSCFKTKLKSFYFLRLNQIFGGDNFCTFKLICPKCRKVNVFTVCSC